MRNFGNGELFSNETVIGLLDYSTLFLTLISRVLMRKCHLLFIFRDGHHSTEDNKRTLRGTMRVGILCNMQILKKDQNFRMVLLLSTKPTLSLLERIHRSFRHHIRVGYHLRPQKPLLWLLLLKHHFMLLEFDTYNISDANK